MNNVIYFPSGTAAPENRFPPGPEHRQDVFTPEQADSLTFEDGQLYGWASREGRLPAHYWRLEADLRSLVTQYGVVTAAQSLALPVLFVRGWVVEIGQAAARIVRSIQGAESTALQPEHGSPVLPSSPLADDAFLWSAQPAYA
jgi:hypothetical protein